MINNILNSISIIAINFQQLIVETNAEILLSINKLNETYPRLPVWSSALSTTFAISVIPYLILFFIPLNNTPEYASHLRVCLSLAAGGLLGDAFLHLIPESLSSLTSHDDRLGVGLWILTGFFGFFIIEKMVRIVKDYQQSGGDVSRCGAAADDNNDNDYNIYDNNMNGNQIFDLKLSKKINNNYNNNNNNICINNNNHNHKICDKLDTDNIDNSDDQNKQIINQKSNSNSVNDIDVAGYLNLVADLVHNFTDGLAIGSSFMAGHSVGLVTGIAIMVHEIPHEIGDFAVLIKSGCSRRRAMSLQLLTAIGALTGTVVSLSMGTVSNSGDNWVLPFTGGGFIYIGTVTILPELSQLTDLKQAFYELFALLFGIFIMILII
ncbi:zinc transporter SLC39A7-like [Oppia nitens]|uniref:zinc transporter SLC39A7-like n=1 Tax=Oppia nitens TaxID=1686743 RepID=UPI0023DCA10F|nr:zinc transporter SLC39A7-like [Oppia nitens]